MSVGRPANDIPGVRKKCKFLYPQRHEAGDGMQSPNAERKSESELFEHESQKKRVRAQERAIEAKADLDAITSARSGMRDWCSLHFLFKLSFNYDFHHSTACIELSFQTSFLEIIQLTDDRS